MKKEFMVERQGKSFVLYAGLLDDAHSKGLTAIRTQLLQIPTAENGSTAICSAVVELDGKTFTGLGDAAPNNVSRLMLPHLIRMAETRAKARALRDAVNVGVAALEEIGGIDDEAAPEIGRNVDTDGVIHQSGKPARREIPLEDVAKPRNGQPDLGTKPPAPATGSAPKSRAKAQTAPPASQPAGLATPAQLAAIYNIGRDTHGWSETDTGAICMDSFGGRTPEMLTKTEASQFISQLQAK